MQTDRSEYLDQLVEKARSGEITRRQFLSIATGLVGAASAVALLAGCAPSPSPAPPGVETPAPTPTAAAAETPAPTATSPAPPGPISGGTLVLGYTSNITNMDPPRVIGQWNNIPWYMAHDGLLRAKRESATEFEPALAESWEVSEDGLKWVFHLRDGVTFHDGTPFDADAVVFNFERIIDPDHPFHTADVAAGVANFRFIEKVEAADDKTVEMTLKWPFPYVDQMIATYDGLMVCPATVQQYGNDSSKHENGTGPFKLTEWVEGDRMVFSAYDDYWDGKPYLDEIVLRTIVEPSTQLAELQAGGVHIVEGITHPRNIPVIQGDPNLQINTLPGYMFSWLGFNLTKPVFQDKNVREAINYAINRQSLADYLYQGLASPGGFEMPEICTYYDPSVPGWEYDPDKAKQLLSEAGYADGLEIDCWQSNIATPQNIVGPELGTTIQADLAAVGIKVKLVTVEYGTLWNVLTEAVGQPEWTTLDTWIDGIRSIVADSDNFLFPRWRSFDAGGFANYAHYNDPTVTDLINQGSETVDTQKRKSIYTEIQQRLRDFAPEAPLVQAQVIFVSRKEVQGFTLFPTVSAGRWHEVWLQS
jgi:ABC-type transport system substrate-binding protein